MSHIADIVSLGHTPDNPRSDLLFPKRHWCLSFQRGIVEGRPFPKGRNGLLYSRRTCHLTCISPWGRSVSSGRCNLRQEGNQREFPCLAGSTSPLCTFGNLRLTWLPLLICKCQPNMGIVCQIWLQLGRNSQRGRVFQRCQPHGKSCLRSKARTHRQEIRSQSSRQISLYSQRGMGIWRVFPSRNSYHCKSNPAGKQLALKSHFPWSHLVDIGNRQCKSGNHSNYCLKFRLKSKSRPPNTSSVRTWDVQRPSRALSLCKRHQPPLLQLDTACMFVDLQR